VTLLTILVATTMWKPARKLS
jgi:hypothetical protein